MINSSLIGIRPYFVKTMGWVFKGPLLLLFLGFPAVVAVASIEVTPSRIYVNPESTGGSEDGTSWSTAYRDLSTALAEAGPSTALWVAKGIYYADPTISQGDAFTLPEGTDLFGGFSGTETSLNDRVVGTDGWFTVYETRLSGDVNLDDIWTETEDCVDINNGKFKDSNSADNHAHVLRMHGANVIDGVTLIGGNSLSVGENGGGAVMLDASNSRITLRNTRLVCNQGQHGGGLFLMNKDKHHLLTNVMFTRNKAKNHGGGFYYELSALGGIGTLTLERLVFVSNVGKRGGGMSYVSKRKESSSELFILETEFIGNLANHGGGLWVNIEPNAGFWGYGERIGFIGNSAKEGGAIGLRNRGDQLNWIFENALFKGNYADHRASAIKYVGGQDSGGNPLGLPASIWLIHSTLSGNDVGRDTSRGLILPYDAEALELKIENSIILGNGDVYPAVELKDYVNAYSVVEGVGATEYEDPDYQFTTVQAEDVFVDPVPLSSKNQIPEGDLHLDCNGSGRDWVIDVTTASSSPNDYDGTLRDDTYDLTKTDLGAYDAASCGDN